jgi:putative acyl-CoA dehydrogenase
MNQPPPLVGYDVYGTDLALVEAVHREGGGGATNSAPSGRLPGRLKRSNGGFAANAHPPMLHTHDRYGDRRDEVTYRPAYHHALLACLE